MGVLKFDDVDDRLGFTSLSAGLGALGQGAHTCVALVKRISDSGDFDALTYLSISGSGINAGMSIDNNDRIRADYDINTPFGPSIFTDITNPYIFALSKAAGSATPRLSWKLGSGGAWTDENLGNIVGNQGASDQLDIANWLIGDPANCWIGLVGWWSGAMSDANKHTLDTNWRTSDWYANAHGQPLFLAQLNVAAASVVDLMGHATNTIQVGTTLDAGETLNGWNFDGIGTQLDKTLTTVNANMKGRRG
jgi:hypothetical protein